MKRLLYLVPTLPLPSERCDTQAAVTIETEQVARALSGDGRAFSDLVEPHLPLLYRIAVRACGDPALAEDAVQEALGLGFASLHRFQAGSSLRAFLAAIAVRRAHTLLRAERRRRAREELAPSGDPSATPAELFDAKGTAERIRTALAAMPRRRREAAWLRIDAGLSYAEIAQALGTSEGSARVLVHLASKELRRLLATELSRAELAPAEPDR